MSRGKTNKQSVQVKKYKQCKWC